MFQWYPYRLFSRFFTYCNDSHWLDHFYEQEAMRNILLLFAKLNPEIRYVQGMNEVLAPLYYVFSTDTDEQNAVRMYPNKMFLIL